MTNQTTFVGGYVPQLVEALTAATLSRQNVIVLGAPGWGKTAISRSLAEGLADGRYSFTRIDPSTPPDAVKGAYNPAALLDGRLERVTAGTPYDPQTRVAIIDEIGRGNEVTFDALLDTLDRVDAPDAATVWATSNFMPASERTAALIDRFGIWFWIEPDTLDAAAVSAAHLNGSHGPQVDLSGLPSWQEIADIRQATPGANAIKAVTELLADLSQEAATQGRRPHPRRVAQWTQLIYRASVWRSGLADFTAVPDQAARLLRYAWPAVTPEEAASWREIAGSVVDALGGAIEGAMAAVFEKMKAVSGATQAERVGMVGGLATLMQSTQATLEKLAGPDDPRVVEAVGRMNNWLAAAVSGRPIE